MSTLLSRYDRHMLDKVDPVDLTVNKTAAYSMSANDLHVNANISAADWTLTLPPIAEAKGRTYTVLVSGDAGSGGLANILTIAPRAKEGEFWGGDVKLRRIGHVAQFYSDGERWFVSSVNAGSPIQHSKHVYENFIVPFSLSNANAGGPPRGTTGDINNLVMANGNFFNYHVKVTQTLLGPIWANPGLNIAGDLTDDDGLEYNHGVGANTPVRFTVGTDPAFFFRVRFTIADVSGTDDCLVGFRKREANQAAVDNYDEMAALNVISGDINIETILNNAATTTTDTTNNWADGETHTLAVLVSAAGVVTYEIDDAAPATTAAFTFDNGEVVIPFFYFLHATTSPGAITLLEWECGYQD